MNFDDLKTFVAVVELGSYTRAGEKLYITQSAVSQKMKRLESHFGKPLLGADNRHRPTRYGELVYNYSKRILSEYDDMMLRIGGNEAKGEIRFGLPEDFANFFLKDVLLDYRKNYPNVFLHLECDLTLNLFEKYSQGAYDLVLVKMNAPEDFPHGVDIMEEKLVWVGDVGLITLGETIPLVLAPKPCVYRSRATSSLSARQIPWEITFSSTSFNSIIAAVSAGMGISVFPKTMVPKSCPIIEHSALPKISNAHISLLKRESNPIIDTFERFMIRKLNLILE